LAVPVFEGNELHYDLHKDPVPGLFGKGEML